MRTRSSRHSLGRLGAAASLAVLLVLGGCGDGGDEAATDSDPPEQTTSSAATEEPDETTSEVPDLCALLSGDDFESVTGAPSAGEPESTPDTGALRGTCTWSAEAGFPMLMIGAYNLADREATLEMVDSEPVDGLGTEADWSDSTGLMIVLDGRDWYLQVFVAGTDDDKEAAFSAAEIALKNLG